eukprot:2495968-Lingulodinium_polyedra.AAC.1
MEEPLKPDDADAASSGRRGGRGPGRDDFVPRTVRAQQAGAQGQRVPVLIARRQALRRREGEWPLL